MAAPSDFRPPPAPPRILKHQIYTDPQFFRAVDNHAIMVAQTQYGNFRDFISDLVFRKKFNELQKARAIFRWMTLKEVHDYTFDAESGQDSPGTILQRFRSGTGYFPDVFECLSLYAGLHCVILSGWAMSLYDEPGMQSTHGPTNHRWNAVHIDGNWQLIDTDRATMSDEDAPGEYNDFYFIPDPSELIYSHFPEDPVWQLCSSTCSKVEFDDYRIVSPNFFTTGMYFLQQNKGVIYTHNGLLVLTLGLKKRTSCSFELTAGDDGSNSIQSVQLRRYMIQETTSRRVSYYFRAPQEGTYNLTVYAQEVPRNLILEKAYKKMCKYKIICNKAAAEIKPFPPSTNGIYCPGVRVMQCGLTSSEKKAILQTSNGQVEVTFTKSFPIEIIADLKNDELTEEQLENAISIEEQGNKVHIKCNLPAPGEYGLNIFSEQPSDKNSYLHICRYLIAYSDEDFTIQYGQVYDQEYSSELVPYGCDPDIYADWSRDLSPGGISDLVYTAVVVAEAEAIPAEEVLEDNLLPTSSICSSQKETKGQPSATERSSRWLIECAICFDEAQEIISSGGKIMSTKCGHIFCETCIKSVLERGATCPTCRSTLSSSDIFRIFLQSVGR